MIKVKSIKRKNAETLWIELLGIEEKFAIPREMAMAHRISPGVEMDDLRWRELLEASALTLAFNQTLKLLSIRCHCSKEIADKLKIRGYSRETINKTLEECERLSLIDDANYAALYIEELRRKKYGLGRIRKAMRDKRIEDEIVSELLEEEGSEDKELEIARRALAAKMKSLSREKDLRKRREKAFRQLRGRGFATGLIFRVLDEALTSNS